MIEPADPPIEYTVDELLVRAAEAIDDAEATSSSRAAELAYLRSLAHSQYLIACAVTTIADHMTRRDAR